MWKSTISLITGSADNRCRLLIICVLHMRIISLCLWYMLCVSYQDQGGEQAEDYETEEQLQVRILTAALQFVPMHGWTVEAIAAGAEVWRVEDVMM